MQAARQAWVATDMLALAVITLVMQVLVHLWAVALGAFLEDWQDLVSVTREACLLVLEAADTATAAWVLVLEAALRLRLRPALEVQPRHQSALVSAGMLLPRARHLWAVALVASHRAVWVQDSEELVVFLEDLAAAEAATVVLEPGWAWAKAARLVPVARARLLETLVAIRRLVLLGPVLPPPMAVAVLRLPARTLPLTAVRPLTQRLELHPVPLMMLRLLTPRLPPVTARAAPLPLTARPLPRTQTQTPHRPPLAMQPLLLLTARAALSQTQTVLLQHPCTVLTARPLLPASPQ